MTNPTMTRNKLEVLRSTKDPARLVKSLKPDATQEAMWAPFGIPAGRCMHRNAAGEMELGVTGNQVPFWLFRDTDKPSGGNTGDGVDVAPHATWADGSEHVLLHFAGIEGLEIATTEFIAATYNMHDFVTAPTVAGYSTDADKKTNAGVVTKTNAVYGKNPVVGVCIEPAGQYYKPHGINMLVFYTLYRPPIAGLPNGIAQPTWL